jgi:phosphatidylcholine synthase
VLIAWLAHAYTASGVVLAFLATLNVIDHQYREAFFWLYLQVFVDATDGVLARRARVATVLPWFNGAKLDDIADYLAYVFVPALIVWNALLVPSAWALPIAFAILLSSAFGFNREDAKTPDHFFTGFPSYWNIVVFYLFVAGLSPLVNAAILVLLVVFVFVPIRYVYPSRTPMLQPVTLTLGIIWAMLMVVMLWQFPAVSALVFWASLVFPAYYVGVSLFLHVRRGAGSGAPRNSVIS